MALEAAPQQTALLQALHYDDNDKASHAAVWTKWRTVPGETQLLFHRPNDARAALGWAIDKLKHLEEEDIVSDLKSLLVEGSSSDLTLLLTTCRAVLSKENAPVTNKDLTGGPARARTERLIARSLIEHDPSVAFQHPETGHSFYLYGVSTGARHIVAHLLERLLVWVKTTSDVDEAAIATMLTEHLLPKQPSSTNSTLTIAVDGGEKDILHDFLEFCSANEVPLVDLYDPKMLENALIEPKGHTETDRQAVMLEKLLQCGICMDEVSLFHRIVEKGDGFHLLAHSLLTNIALENRTSLFNAANKKNIVAKGCSELWGVCFAFIPASIELEGLVHLAVQHRRLDVVNDLLKRQPSLAVALDDLGHYPLWYIYPSERERPPPQDLVDSRKIRDTLVSALVWYKDAGTISEVMNSCRNKGLTAHSKYSSLLDIDNFGLNLGHVDTVKHDFVQFLNNMKQKSQDTEGSGPIKFEKVLRRVQFPELQAVGVTPETEKIEEHYEVATTLAWLRQTMGVDRIKKLVVPDRRQQPHDWLCIHSCVKTFSIQSLDWRALDLCLTHCDRTRTLGAELDDLEVCYDYLPTTETSQQGANHDTLAHSLSTVESLYLYTGGERNTIQHWLGHDGLIRLKRLKKLKIWIVKDLIMSKNVERLQTSLKAALAHLKDSEGLTWSFDVEPRSWTTVEDVRPQRSETGTIMPISSLARFVDRYWDLFNHTKTRFPLKPTKVAIIDDGFMFASDPTARSLQNRASQRIKGAKSFVFKDKHASQWFLPGSDGHGTQMACLISSLDPCCELFIGQVCAPKVQLTMNAVSEAIKWAHMNDVDIISLSLGLRRGEDDDENHLLTAVNNADSSHVVMICSTMDEGRNETLDSSSLNKYHGRTIPITASDRYGNPLDFSQRHGPGYRLNGRDITIGELEYLNADAKATGSSVATATAAGIASLILACHRLARTIEAERGIDDKPDNWRKELIESKFHSMQTDPNDKYVMPRNLCGDGNLEGRLGPDDVRALIQKHFK